MRTGKELFNTLLVELNEMGLPGMSSTLDEMYRSPKFLELDPLTAIANLLLPDCNFFFTREGSEGSPLEILIQRFGTPWWLVVYAMLALLLLTLEFLPWRIFHKQKA